MGDPVSIALIAGTVLSAAGTGYSVYKGQKQQEAAKDAASDQKDEAARQRAELLEKQKQEQASTAAHDARQRQMSTTNQRKRQSVYTTPLGLPELGSFKGRSLSGGGQ